ncbi:unnamed protein product [Clavelina lepadiformis]|uniref:Uncharacterized protein n=1 Tax=Clavelina lepadiformis TaxID=159417 RepID=A0ABP0EZD7_CLALP
MTEQQAANETNDDIAELDTDQTTQKQWETINNHLKQMHVWADEVNSNLSTSPGAQVKSRTPKSHPPHNPMYRRSEGDIQGKPLDKTKLATPPQSAPVLPEGFVLQWGGNAMNPPQNSSNRDLQKAYDYKQHAKSNFTFVKNPPFVNQPVHISTVGVGTNNVAPNVQPNMPRMHINDSHNFPANSTDYSFAYNYGNTSGNTSPHVARQVSSPSLLGGNLVHGPQQLVSDGHRKSFQNSHGPIPPRTQSFVTTGHHALNPGDRRRSEPATDKSNFKNKGYPRRAISSVHGQPGVIPNFIPFHHPDTFMPPSSVPVIIAEPDPASGSQSNESYDDQDYTKALLQHQNERMARLQAEFQAKEKELTLLVADIKDLETRVIQRNNTRYKIPSSLATLQTDVARLREINRKLEIDCNCMHKEVDLFSRDGDSTREDFYSRYNRPSTVKNKKPGK